MLVSLRVDFSNHVCDILTKYTPDEVSTLVVQGQVSPSLVSSTVIAPTKTTKQQGSRGFVMGDDEDDPLSYLVFSATSGPEVDISFI